MINAFVTAAVVAAAPLPAAQAPRALSIDGVEATYVRWIAADGTVNLAGEYRLERERTPFHYRLKGDRVRAEIGGRRYVLPLPAR